MQPSSAASGAAGKRAERRRCAVILQSTMYGNRLGTISRAQIDNALCDAEIVVPGKHRIIPASRKQISAATNPMLLFMLGAFFQWGGIHKYIKDLVEVCLGRLVVMPGIFLTAAYFLGIRGIAFAGMIAIFGSATAIASFTMVQQMGGDDELAGDIVVSTSALCCFTMFAWSFIFKSLGVF